MPAQGKRTTGGQNEAGTRAAEATSRADATQQVEYWSPAANCQRVESRARRGKACLEFGRCEPTRGDREQVFEQPRQGRKMQMKPAADDVMPPGE